MHSQTFHAPDFSHDAYLTARAYSQVRLSIRTLFDTMPLRQLCMRDLVNLAVLQHNLGCPVGSGVCPAPSKVTSMISYNGCQPRPESSTIEHTACNSPWSPLSLRDWICIRIGTGPITAVDMPCHVPRLPGRASERHGQGKRRKQAIAC